MHSQQEAPKSTLLSQYLATVKNRLEKEERWIKFKLLEILVGNIQTLIKTVVMWKERRNARENSGMESIQFGNDYGGCETV